MRMKRKLERKKKRDERKSLEMEKFTEKRLERHKGEDVY